MKKLSLNSEKKYNDASELDIKFAQIADSKYIPEISNLKEKLQSEKLSSDLEKQKISLLNLIDSFNDFFLNTLHY